jgi:hypothetical protein
MLYRAAVVCLVAVFGAGASADTIYFSIDAASPSLPGVSNNDVLAPGPVGGPPAVATLAGALGLSPTDELDAVTIGGPVDPLAIFFSVDRAAAGLPLAGDVFTEAAAGQAAGDVFVSGGGGTNTLVFNQDILGLLPATPPGTPASGAIDNLDALDLAGAVGPGVGIYSLLAGNSFGFSGADILFTPTAGGPPTILVTALALGLSVADDIDALHLDTLTGDCLFSLVPSSPSLTALAAGPGDILVAPGCGGGPAPSVLFAAITLGLAPVDNLDGLAFISEIPEPGSFGLVTLGLAALAGLGRRRTAEF